MNEIEEMAATIALYTPINCNPNKIATALVNAGYGDVEQAQIEILKELKAELENYRSIERTQLLGIVNGYIAKLEN
jgi:precorrin-6B methylase 1